MPQCGCRRAEAPRPSTDPVPDEGRSMNSPLKGHPSTHGDSYQLNTTNLFRQAVVTHPEQEIHHRDGDGQWRTTTYAATWERNADRQTGEAGKRGSVRGDTGGRRTLKKK